MSRRVIVPRRPRFAIGACVALALTPLMTARAQVHDSDFVLIKPGTFQMGDAHNGPVHPVSLTRSFWIQKTAVTRAQWSAVMHTSPREVRECGGACPVGNVSYLDAQAFVAALNRRAPSRKYRLPTEAEWAFAAHADTLGAGETGLGAARCDPHLERNGGMPQPVRQGQPNARGVYDMGDNVLEWVSDWFAPFTANPRTNPAGPATGEVRVIRGACFNLDLTRATSALGTRTHSSPQSETASIGFRLARSP
jgi:formylglycine-generating enzyme required for sulfatase activity